MFQAMTWVCEQRLCSGNRWYRTGCCGPPRGPSGAFCCDCLPVRKQPLRYRRRQSCLLDLAIPSITPSANHIAYGLCGHRITVPAQLFRWRCPSGDLRRALAITTVAPTALLCDVSSKRWSPEKENTRHDFTCPLDALSISIRCSTRAPGIRAGQDAACCL
ncbi:hypothetical protein EXIGLDRAFT_83751 [Exidia glandulosa HHB12029]|uniref:Uncharacterized protein n=1 Tax=Exidia glandulosa HHB12029 TaxID=1314781 RepID=A0A165HJR5_EXIGL|nr:hypothetical protein EXIGLDRAFT_83751 [Exidia glandulosa HHB12029]